MNNYVVYMHVNKVNDKKYIGITKQNPEKRWGKGNKYKSSPHFYSSILKYGWDNFEHLIMFKNLSGFDAKAKEVELIAFYKAMNKNFGYNCTMGGEGTSGFKPSKTTIEKMRKARLGSKASKETKDKMRKIMTGRIMSESWKSKISESHIGDKNPTAKPVVQLNSNYELIKEFSCGRYAEQELGINVVNISQVCLGRSNSASGFIFMFKEEYENKKEYLIGKHVDIQPYRKKIIQLSVQGETIQEFNSISEASKILKIDSSSIGNVCKGIKQKTAGGFKWEYA